MSKILLFIGHRGNMDKSLDSKTLVTKLLEIIAILPRGNLLLVNRLIHRETQRLWST